MTARPLVALWVVGWVVVAVAGATLAWAVISRAGGGVSGDLESVTEPSSGTRSPKSPTTSASDPRSPKTSDRSPSATAAGGGAPVSETWEGEAGVVSVTCRGPVISLDSAIAYSGYVLERDDVGPDRVRVEMESEDVRFRIEAECVDGDPVITEDRNGDG
jgi:hypothetical protein